MAVVEKLGKEIENKAHGFVKASHLRFISAENSKLPIASDLGIIWPAILGYRAKSLQRDLEEEEARCIRQLKLNNKPNKQNSRLSGLNKCSLFLYTHPRHIGEDSAVARPHQGPHWQKAPLSGMIGFSAIGRRAGDTVYTCSYLCSHFTIQGKVCVHTLLQGHNESRGA